MSAQFAYAFDNDNDDNEDYPEQAALRPHFNFTVTHAEKLSWVDVAPAADTAPLFPPGFRENGCSSTFRDLRSLLYLAVHHIRGELEAQNAEIPQEMAFTGPDGETLVLPLARY